MVLTSDVACFKYSPHLVPLTLLWEAMDNVDDSTSISTPTPFAEAAT